METPHLKPEPVLKVQHQTPSTALLYCMHFQGETTEQLLLNITAKQSLRLTGTVASSTITQTTTTTVADITVTQISSAPATYDTTVNVTNSTQSGP